MEKKSILCLEKTLFDLGYYPEHIECYIYTIDQILQSGVVTVNRIDRNGRRPAVICAAGIHPFFKINPKSIYVFLNTTRELNVLRIIHPSNPYSKGEIAAGCYLGNQRWLAGNIWDENRGPDKGFIFTNNKCSNSDYLKADGMDES